MGQYLMNCGLDPTELPLLRNPYSRIREERAFPAALCALQGKGKRKPKYFQKQSGDTHCGMWDCGTFTNEISYTGSVDELDLQAKQCGG